MSNKVINLFFICIVVILNFALYFNSLGHSFLGDTYVLVHERNTDDILKTFYSSWEPSGKVLGIDRFYRPLVIISFHLNYLISKLNTRAYYLTNLLFHIIAAVLLYLMNLILTKRNSVAFFSSLLFSISPSNTPAIAILSYRTNSMVLIFFCASLISYMISFKNKNGYFPAFSFLFFHY